MTVASEARNAALEIISLLNRATALVREGDPTALPVIQAVTQIGSLRRRGQTLLAAGNLSPDVGDDLDSAMIYAQRAVDSIRSSQADPERVRRIREQAAALEEDDGETPSGGGGGGGGGGTPSTPAPQTQEPQPQGWQGDWENKTLNAGEGGALTRINQWLAEPNVPWYQQRWLYVTGALAFSAAAYFYWKEAQGK
jgi:hypothetical protein